MLSSLYRCFSFEITIPYMGEWVSHTNNLTFTCHCEMSLHKGQVWRCNAAIFSSTHIIMFQSPAKFNISNRLLDYFLHVAMFFGIRFLYSILLSMQNFDERNFLSDDYLSPFLLCFWRLLHLLNPEVRIIKTHRTFRQLVWQTSRGDCRDCETPHWINILVFEDS